MNFNIERRANQEKHVLTRLGFEPTNTCSWSVLKCHHLNAPRLLLVILTAIWDWAGDILSPNQLGNNLPMPMLCYALVRIYAIKTTTWWFLMLWPWHLTFTFDLMQDYCRSVSLSISPIGIFPGIQTLEECRKEALRYVHACRGPIVWRHNPIFQLNMVDLVMHQSLTTPWGGDGSG